MNEPTRLEQLAYQAEVTPRWLRLHLFSEITRRRLTTPRRASGATKARKEPQ